MGSDAATLVATLGLLGLAMEAGRQPRRISVVLSSTMLVLAHLASPQRAARLGLAATLVALVVCLVWPRRRRFAIAGGEVVLVVALMAAVVAGSVFLHAARGESSRSVAASVPFIGLSTQAVDPTYRQGSVHSRFNEWTHARSMIAQRPLVGYGLGKVYTHYDEGTRTFITYDIANNLVLDLLLRTGIVGLVLFFAAAGSTLGAGWRAWRLLPDDSESLVVLMASSALVGLLAKAMVETVINEYRLTPLLGFLVGLLIAGGKASESLSGRHQADAAGSSPSTAPDLVGTSKPR
jgi:O-antigen ligase